MATHTDSKRTLKAHDTSCDRRQSRKQKSFESHLADRAMERLMREFGSKAGE